MVGLAELITLLWKVLKESKANKEHTNNQQREFLKVASKAVRKTLSYIGQGNVRDTKTEEELSELWANVALAARPFDSDLAERCYLKGNYWANPSSWSNEQIKTARIEIKQIDAEIGKHFKGKVRAKESKQKAVETSPLLPNKKLSNPKQSAETEQGSLQAIIEVLKNFHKSQKTIKDFEAAKSALPPIAKIYDILCRSKDQCGAKTTNVIIWLGEAANNRSGYRMALLNELACPEVIADLEKWQEKPAGIEKEGRVKPKPPVIIQNIEWIRIYGRKYWKHVVIAFVISGFWWIPKVISIWGEAKVSDEASVSRDTLTQDSGQQTVVNNEGDGNISVTHRPGVDVKEYGEINKELGKTEQELKQVKNDKQELEQVVNAYRSEDKEKRAILMLAENEEKIKLHVKIFQEQKTGNVSAEDLSKLCDLVNKASWEDLKSFIEDKNIKIDEHNQSLVLSGIFKGEITGGGDRARYNPAKMVYVLTPEGNTLYEIATTEED